MVAQEVRGLSQRSADRAAEIRRLINESVDTVDSGAEHVTAAARFLQEIGGAVQTLSHHVSEIAGANRQQARGMAQLTDSLTDLNETTQQNAALVEENAAASANLKDQAEEVAQLAQLFCRVDRLLLHELAGLAGELGGQVNGFVLKVRKFFDIAEHYG